MKMGKWLHIAHYNNVPIMIKDGNVISETDFRAGIDSETLSRMRMASMELEKR